MAEQAKNLPESVLAEIRNEIYMAEGSDWCWWYGDEHATENAQEFDQLFRSHLIRIYELLNQTVPVKLYEPIRIESLKKILLTEPMGFIHPIIDGLESNYFEWIAAGVFDTKQQGSAMHQMAQFVEIIHYGFDLSNFYLKVVQQKRYFGKEIKKYAIELDIFEPAAMVLRVEFQMLIPEQIVETILLKQKERWLPMEDGIRVAFNQFLEMSIPFSFMQCPEGVTVRFQIKVYKEDNLLETWPKNGVIRFVVPNSEFERIEWIV